MKTQLVKFLKGTKLYLEETVNVNNDCKNSLGFRMLFEIWPVDVVRWKEYNGLMSTGSGPKWVLDWVKLSSAKKVQKGYVSTQWMNVWKQK